MTTALPTGSVRSSVDVACRFRPIVGGGFRAAMEITRRCNLSCSHCFGPNQRPEPKLAELVAIIRKLRQLGCRKLVLTGGEPLLRSDLEAIIRGTVNAGVGVDLNSNLVGLGIARADALTSAGLGEASVTFYGDRVFHDAFVGRAGAHESTLQSCRLLRERGVEIDVHGPLWDENLRCAEHVCDLAESLGAESLTFFKVIAPSGTDAGRPFGGTRFGASEDQFPAASLDAVASIVRRLRERGKFPVRTIGFWTPQNDKCEKGCSIVGITADLQMSPCLLSRRRTLQARPVTSDTVEETLTALRQEVREGLWEPLCGMVSDGLPADHVGS